jgi:hypothetical protein
MNGPDWRATPGEGFVQIGFCTGSTGLRISGKNNYCGDLTDFEKSVYLQMARG